MIKKLSYIFALTLAVLSLSSGPALAAGSATLSLGPISKPAEVGKTFVVNVSINPGGSIVDTARASLSFNSSLITAVNVNLAGSLDSPSPGNSINNGTGNISWGGFTVNRPITAPGIFARVTFKAVAVGDATIKIMGDSRLISDGEEVGNPAGFNQVAVKIVPAGEGSNSPIQLSSPTHPDSDKWYQATTAEFVWNAIPGATYVWQWDRDPESAPSQSAKETGKSFRNVKSGIWYFHLQAKLPDGKLTDPINYRVQVDNVKPNPIEPYLDVDDQGQLTVRFATTDYHSGIASYDLRVNDQDIENAPNPYVLKGLNVGENLIAVTAYDLAGNVRQGWVKFVLNSDGTIRDITVSQNVCRLPFGCDTAGYLELGGIPLALLGLYLLLRRRSAATGSEVIAGVPGNQTITKAVRLPNGTYSRTSIHTHTHSYTDTDTYSDTAPNAPVPPTAHPSEDSSNTSKGLENHKQKGSNAKRKKR